MKIWPSSDKAKNKDPDQSARMIRAPVTTKISALPYFASLSVPSSLQTGLCLICQEHETRFFCEDAYLTESM